MYRNTEDIMIYTEKNEFFKAIAEKKGTEILKENLTSLPMLGLLLNVSTIFT